MKKIIITTLSLLFITSCSVTTTTTHEIKKNQPIYGSSLFTEQSDSFTYLANTKEKPKLLKKKPFFVLEIEGGALGGIIPLKVLNHLETKSGKPISKFFDLIVGTSTGTIIAASLSAPDKNNKPLYNTQQTLDFYENLGHTIFYDPFGHKMDTAWGLYGPIYERNNWNIVLNDLFGNVKISQSLTNIILSEYSLSLRRIFYFNSLKAQKNKNYDFFIKDALSASTSTPMIFSPRYYCNVPNTFCDRGVDAGLAINNPVVRAYLFARELAPDRPIVLVSLGDGVTPIISNEQIANKIEYWGILKLRSWLEIFQKAINKSANAEMRNFIKIMPDNNILAYIRINAKFEKDINVFNPSKKDIKRLKLAGDKAVSNNLSTLDYLIQLSTEK